MTKTFHQISPLAQAQSRLRATRQLIASANQLNAEKREAGSKPLTQEQRLEAWTAEILKSKSQAHWKRRTQG